MVVVSDGIANLAVGHVLYVGAEETDLAGSQLLHFHRLWSQDSERFYVEGAAVRHQADVLALVQRALNDTGEHDDATIRIEPGIENQRLKLVRRAPFRWRNPLDDRLQHFGHALP